jgi:NAD(P)-dependent dehydrogenase (short-subunit alcohol dehydrogenase family)
MLTRIIDTALEATIVPSFTRIGPSIRRRIDEWEPITTDLTGRTVLVTGGSSGLGRETASRLIDLGATVLLTSRSVERAERVAAELNDAGGPGQAVGHSLDTADFDSIRALVAEIERSTDHLDVLIHNAGALVDEHRTNDDGIELTLASHLVGPYALTKLLREHLSQGAKVLWMSSGGMYTQGLDVDEIEMEPDGFRGSIAYARAKRGQVELVTHLGPRWAPDLVMHAMHPGWVDTDGVAQGLPGFGKVMGPLLRQPVDGADTMVWLAAGGADGQEPGQFWLDRRPRSTTYLPGTGTDASERERLAEWLDLMTLPAEVG